MFEPVVDDALRARLLEALDTVLPPVTGLAVLGVIERELATAEAGIAQRVRNLVAAEIESVVVLARKDQRPGEAKAEAYQLAARIARGEDW